MKVSEMIKNLQAFIEEFGDYECWAANEEGSAFNPVKHTPSLFFALKEDALPYQYDVHDIYTEDEFEDYGYKEEEMEKICVIN